MSRSVDKLSLILEKGGYRLRGMRYPDPNMGTTWHYALESDRRDVYGTRYWETVWEWRSTDGLPLLMSGNDAMWLIKQLLIALDTTPDDAQG